VDSALPAAAAVALEAATVVVADSVVATEVAVMAVVAAADSVVATVAVDAAEEAVVAAVIKPTFHPDPEIGNAPSSTAETLIFHGETNVTNVKPPNPQVLEVILAAEVVAASVAAAAEVAVEAVASVVATVMVVAAAEDSAVVAAVTEEVVVVAEDSAAVTVEAAAEVDSVAAVVVAAAVPCVEAAEAETETVPTKHPTTSMLQEENSTKTIFKKPRPSQELLQSCHAPTNNIQEEAKPHFFNPLFFSAAVEMSDQYFITSKVILGLAETILKLSALTYYNIRSVALLVRPLILLSTDLDSKQPLI